MTTHNVDPDSHQSFPPHAPAEARVLVLGSFPSARSLAATQYYGHPQNAFWPIMGELFGAGLDLPYADRLDRLGRAGVALWDVAHTCRREGSADATMRDIAPNDIPGLLATRCPKVGAIFCNGRKSEQLFRRLVLPSLPPGLTLDYLPSTSPAHAGMTRGEKVEEWRRVAEWLLRNPE